MIIISLFLILEYDSVLTPLFHMIELYVQQYTELFISNSGEEASNEPQTIEKGSRNRLN